MTQIVLPDGSPAVRGPAKPRQPTPADWSHAVEDAQQLAAASPVIRTALTLEIAAEQLSRLAQRVLSDEIREGWTVVNPPLVFQTLVESARRQAGRTGGIAELLQMLVESVVPAVDTIRQMLADKANAPKIEEAANESEVVRGDPDGSPSGVGELLCGTDSGQELHEAGLNPGGDCEKESGTPA